MLSLKDAALTQTGNLPNGAGSTNTTALDLGLSSQGELSVRGEFVITAPALTTSELPDTQTMSYHLIVSASSNLGTPTVIYKSVLPQTGAGGAGAAGASARSNCRTIRAAAHLSCATWAFAQPTAARGIRARRRSRWTFAPELRAERRPLQRRDERCPTVEQSEPARRSSSY